MMNRSLLIILLFAIPHLVKSQTINSTFTIKTNQKFHKVISPYIYGTNGQEDDAIINATARRLGGNRLTGYNWENNCSNAGTDYYNRSDLYLVPSGSSADTPAVAMTEFHKTSLALNAYTLQTLQMAGYVARDNYNDVFASQVAPSFRWKQVKNVKGSAFTLHPDTADAYVYMDELVNLLVTKFGKANTATGIKGYSLDNESPLWKDKHPYIHPAAVGCTEEIDKSVALAKAVKAVDPYAEIYGPVFSAYNEMASFKCPDWNTYSPYYDSYVKAYVAEIKAQSEVAGIRLVDVLDIHWYPEGMGRNNAGTKERVYGGGNDRGVALARMQAPRSLWDVNYIEDSWLNGGGAGSSGNQGGYPLNALNKYVFPALNTYSSSPYAINKVAFTEYDFGGHNHISGGIAQADLFGVFSAQGIYMGNFWGGVSGYVASAYKLYRDYDGKKSTYGSVAVNASTNNNDSTSVYASINSPGDSSQLHLIVLAKSWTNDINATFNLTTQQNYKSAKVYRFNSQSLNINYIDSISINGGVKTFTYLLPHLTAAHIILDTASLKGPGNLSTAIDPVISYPRFLNIYPNPFDHSTTVEFNIPSEAHVTLEITDILGKKIRTEYDQNMSVGNHSIIVERNNLPSGIYFCKLSVNGQSAITKLVVN